MFCLQVLPNNSVLSSLSLSEKSGIYPEDADGHLHPRLDLFSILFRRTFLLALVEYSCVVLFFSYL